jgi:hypothetical protein
MKVNEFLFERTFTASKLSVLLRPLLGSHKAAMMEEKALEN